jgi:hypothetical protein
MENGRRVRFVMSLSIVAALFAGCGGWQPPVDSPNTMPHNAAVPTHDHHGSWMLPEAQSEDLLYIANVHDVTVYSYPKAKLVGTLKGFYVPGGECTDKAGDFFIGQYPNELEYRHGGKKPIKKLTMPGYVALGCSVDPTTGKLAVTWNQSASSENYVAVYQHASGSPTLYGLKGDFFGYCGYDDKGDLFVDGQVGYVSQYVFLRELPNGANKLKNITLNQTFGHAGAVQWDGRYVAMGDDVAQKIYRFMISGSRAKLEGTVDLGSAQSVYEWWIDGNRVIGPDDVPMKVDYWRYPEGGSPTKTFNKGVQAPSAATVSKLPKA